MDGLWKLLRWLRAWKRRDAVSRHITIELSCLAFAEDGPFSENDGLLNEVETPVSSATPDGGFLIEQTDIPHDTCYAVIDFLLSPYLSIRFTRSNLLSAGKAISTLLLSCLCAVLSVQGEHPYLKGKAWDVMLPIYLVHTLKQ